MNTMILFDIVQSSCSALAGVHIRKQINEIYEKQRETKTFTQFRTLFPSFNYFKIREEDSTRCRINQIARGAERHDFRFGILRNLNYHIKMVHGCHN